MEENIARVLIEATVQKSLKEMRDFPERGIRNLIDMGVEFSGGRFQRYFFAIAQSMLQNEDSAYYQLIRNIIHYVDLDKVKQFGINLGYNSCTMGAKRIQTVETLECFGIPWSLGFFMHGQSDMLREKQYRTIVAQGTKLGIYTYFIYADGEPWRVLPLIQTYSQCAFILFCRPDDITPRFLNEAQQILNMLIAVEWCDGIESICRCLKRNGLLYAVYFLYQKEDFWNILNGTVLSRIEKAAPPVTVFVPHSSCPERMQENVYQYVLDVRKKQHDPTILLDAKYDNMYVEEVISRHSCMAWFDREGQLHSYNRKYMSADYNIFQNKLHSILKQAFSEGSEEEGLKSNENRNY